MADVWSEKFHSENKNILQIHGQLLQLLFEILHTSNSTRSLLNRTVKCHIVARYRWYIIKAAISFFSGSCEGAILVIIL